MRSITKLKARRKAFYQRHKERIKAESQRRRVLNRGKPLTEEQKKIKREQARVRYHNNPDKFRAYNRESAFKHRDKVSERNSKWHLEKPAEVMIHCAKSRAKMKGLPFTLTENDITIPTHCPVLSIPLFKTPHKRTDNTPTLERINPELGYVKGNVLVISWRANKIRNVATVEELQKIAQFYLSLS